MPIRCQSLHVAVLPYIDQVALANKYTFDGDYPHNEGRRIAIFLCPSDSENHRNDDAGIWRPTNYAVNYASAYQVAGFDGMAKNCLPTVSFVAPQDVRDGMSSTAYISEKLVHSETASRLRWGWVTNFARLYPAEIENFANLCSQVPTDAERVTSGSGGTWWDVGPGLNLYSHVLTPNLPSCSNGRQGFLEGAYTASSAHPGIVKTLFVDGHVQSISESVDRLLWRAIASRDGAEIVSKF